MYKNVESTIFCLRRKRFSNVSRQSIEILVAFLIATLRALDLFYGADYETGNGACVVPLLRQSYKDFLRRIAIRCSRPRKEVDSAERYLAYANDVNCFNTFPRECFESVGLFT